MIKLPLHKRRSTSATALPCYYPCNSHFSIATILYILINTSTHQSAESVAFTLQTSVLCVHKTSLPIVTLSAIITPLRSSKKAGKVLRDNILSTASYHLEPIAWPVLFVKTTDLTTPEKFLGAKLVCLH